MTLDEYLNSALDVEYLLDEIEHGLLRNTVERCFLMLDGSIGPEKVAELILSGLFAKLVKGFNFVDFLQNIPIVERTVFISDLLFHIYYLHFDLKSLIDKESLEFYLIKIFAAKASEKTIQNIFIQLTLPKQIKLYGLCLARLDEGAYRLLHATKDLAPSELVTIISLASKTDISGWIENEGDVSKKSLKDALAAVNRDVQQQVETITLHLNKKKKSCSADQVKKFVDIFGLYNHQVPKSASYLNEHESLAAKFLHLGKGGKIFIDAIYNHVWALSFAPESYVAGVNMITYALPTRAKDLSQFAWLSSTVEALEFFCKKLHIANNIPIFVFDQSEKTLFDKNAQYIQSLSTNIVHMNPEPLITLAKALEIEGLFVTDSLGEFGFGGSRNVIFLLTPLLSYYYKKNIDFSTLAKAKLRQDFQDVVLKENQGPVVVHMGDDDVHVARSTIFSDALFAFTHQNEYFCRYGWLTGRKTVTIDTTFDLEKVVSRPHAIILQHNFQNEPFSHGMATLLTKPKLCMNLPFGSEEVYLNSMKNYDFDFREVAVHLSGERFPKIEIPQNRFSGLADLLKTHYKYIHGMRLVVDLIDPTNRLKSCILPWNERRTPFKTLFEAIKYIVRPSTIEKMQKQWQQNFASLANALESYQYKANERPKFATLSLTALDTLDIEAILKPYQEQFPKEMLELKKLFTDLVEDYRHLLQFLRDEKHDYGSNLTHSLARLTNVIESATFQSWLKRALAPLFNAH